MLENSRHPNGNGNGTATGTATVTLSRCAAFAGRAAPGQGRTAIGREVNVGLVGLGYWGPNLLRVLADKPDVRVRWICDQAPDRLERMTRRYPAVAATTEFGDLLDDPELDAILIATPVGTHAELATASLDGGQAHVRREASRGLGRRGRGAGPDRARGRPRADVRPHVHLQPAGPRGEGAARLQASSATCTSSPRAA